MVRVHPGPPLNIFDKNVQISYNSYAHKPILVGGKTSMWARLEPLKLNTIDEITDIRNPRSNFSCEQIFNRQFQRIKQRTK